MMISNNSKSSHPFATLILKIIPSFIRSPPSLARRARRRIFHIYIHWLMFNFWSSRYGGSRAKGRTRPDIDLWVFATSNKNVILISDNSCYYTLTYSEEIQLTVSSHSSDLTTPTCPVVHTLSRDQSESEVERFELVIRATSPLKYRCL